MTPQHLDKKLISWASILDGATHGQALKTASMPFVYPHMALMPDAHLGKGATVGSVIPTQGAIIPAAIGVDIGCGMCAVRTDVHIDETEGWDRGALREAIEKTIPLSAGKYNRGYYSMMTDRYVGLLESQAMMESVFNPDTYASNWRLQLGSLGSGNHFIEVTIDQEGMIWLFLHSGSRGIGNKIAMHHIKVAQEVCAKWHISLPDPDLAYLIEDSHEFAEYIRQMQWAQHFALLNREDMMMRLVDCFSAWASERSWSETLRINCHHNYTTRERHFNQEVWLTRKGAIDASEGTWGLIPGSMGTASYVVRGKGNPVALNSAPHGAGRNGSRAWARKAFTFEQLERDMEGIEWNPKKAFLDEIPGAYKPIDLVMEDAQDLVEVKYTLKQILNVKGE